jgi:hypothetical protein
MTRPPTVTRSRARHRPQSRPHLAMMRGGAESSATSDMSSRLARTLRNNGEPNVL